MKRFILFDIDGTLLRTRGAGSHAFTRALADVLPGASLPASFSPHGRTDPDIFREIGEHIYSRPATDRELTTLADRYIHHFQTTLAEAKNFEVFPGIEKLVKELHADEKVALGIETGNLEITARLKLKRGALDHFFSFGGFGSDAPDRSEIVRIALERGLNLVGGKTQGRLSPIIIGDSIQDMKAAKSNGAFAVGVLTGGADQGALKKAGADKVFTDFSSSSEFLELLLELVV
ncbi:MAG: HAD hydrolase-like protein [Bdellovibrionales bacterium]|nr:HAD hydrolase-like protein [Bdellovibrionales bacterium]